MSGVLKFFGVIMILIALLFAGAGALVLVGAANELLESYEAAGYVLAIAAFVLAIIALIAGITCFAAPKAARVFGVIFAAYGLFSLISTQITQDKFDIMSCILCVLGISIFYVSHKLIKQKN